jgi:DNA-binding winged helix-turn-helix (wHTH) protein/TolB-like protein/Tfp pilus assembly protein PilF
MSESLLKSGVLKFGDVVIDRGSFSISRGGQPAVLAPRAFDVLVYLIENRGRVVEKQELFEAVWKDTFVSDNALMRAIREIRRELGDSATESKYVETVHKRGYRFIAEVEAGDVVDRSEVVEGYQDDGPSETSLHSPNAHSPSRSGRRSGIFLASGLIVAAILIATVFVIYFFRSETPIRSIVVIPLENGISGADTEHLSDGITESVINSLSELPDVKVVARATAFRYRGETFDPVRIRRELGVEAILTGRIVRTGDELTIQTELIDASDGSQIWGSRYSRTIASAFELPGAIAGGVARKLGLSLSPDQVSRLERTYTQNKEAYELYQRGRFFWNKRSEEGLKKSIEYFEQAIEKDPNYALAYAGMADSYAVMAISADLPAHEVFPKAKEAATKALELDGDLVEAHATMLRIRSQYEWDWAGAESSYRKALEANANYPMTHIYYLSTLVSTGRADEAVTSVKRAQELDPLSLVANAVVARALFFAGRYDEAIAAAQKTLELEPNVYLARLILGRSYARKGMSDEAIAELDKARGLPGANSESTSLLAHTLAVAGRTPEARQLLVELKQLSSTRYVQPFDIAIVHAGLGDREAALEWLEKAYQDRNHQIALMDYVPEFEDLRQDPRFSEIVRSISAGR